MSAGTRRKTGAYASSAAYNGRSVMPYRAVFGSCGSYSCLDVGGCCGSKTSGYLGRRWRGGSSFSYDGTNSGRSYSGRSTFGYVSPTVSPTRSDSALVGCYVFESSDELTTQRCWISSRATSLDWV